jgi:iron complex transport system ATP-binding protein
METLRLENLSIGYTEHHKTIKTVMKGLNASLYSGQLTCLLGANGVGKSTLLKTLSAFQRPLSGQILLEGQSLSNYSTHQLSKLISIVLTEKPRVRNMTIAEMVGLGRSPYTGFWGRLSARDKKVVGDSLDLIGITALKDRFIQTLSDGERQKMMIAKALAQQTPIIFLDEPTAFLDFPSKVEMLLLLRRLAHEMDKTVFLSTHDFELVLQVADVLWLMDEKQGLSAGSPKELSESGDLSRYVERKGIAFDRETMRVTVLKNE